MQAQIQERTERVLVIEKPDSMGCNRAQREALAANAPRPVKLGDAAREIAAIVASEHGEYPKALYRLALRKGLPAGDIVNPDYPMPYDLALQLGLTECGFKVIGKHSNSPGNVVIRLPYITRIVGVVREDLSVDVEAARAEEAKLLKQGWVTAPHLIKGLPTPAIEEPFDPLPDDVPEAKAARNGAR